MITATVIWKDGHFVGNCSTPQGLNCELFTGQPRTAWLQKTSYCCGGDEAYVVVFADPADINALKGVWLEQNGKGMFIDAATTDAVTTACNVCCGNPAVVTPVYNGTFPTPVAPLAKTFTISRTDLGNLLATERAMVAYMDWIIDGTFLKTAYSGGVSTYVFQSYSDPIPQGTDTYVETPRVFTSNTAPSLTGSNVFSVSGVLDTVAYGPFRTGATTLANAVIALQADAVMGAKGTWAVAGSTITLSTKLYDRGTVVLGQVA